MIKKIFAGMLAITFAISAFSATLNQIQLLNPAGSSSGQVITSTGASTAPAWSSITPSGIGALTQANNLSDVANVGTARSNLGLGTMSLQNANAVGITGGAIASTPISGSTGAFTTISASGLITPTSTIGIKATSTNDNPASGSFGEYAKGSTTGTSLSNNTVASCATLSLTPGDWDVTGILLTAPATTTTTSNVNAGISTSATAFITAATGINNIVTFPVSLPANVGVSLSLPSTRISIASTTSVFVAAQVAFATSTMTCSGFIQARRAPH